MTTTVSAWPEVLLGKVLRKSDDWTDIEPQTEYAQVTVRLHGKGVALRGVVPGPQIAASSQVTVHRNQFIMSRIDARNGAFGLIPDELEGAVVSNDFPAFDVDETQLLPEFLAWMSKTHAFVELCQHASEGTTNRVRLKEDRFLAAAIPLPPLEEQRRIVARIEALAARIAEARALRQAAMAEAEALWGAAVERSLLDGHAEAVRLGDILAEDSLNGLSAHPTASPPGTPILRISAGTSRHDALVDEADYRYLEVDESVVSKYRLRNGDVLACRFNGNLSNVGKFSLYQGYSDMTHIYPDKLIRFRLNLRCADPRYVTLAMNSRTVRASIESHCATTAGNIGISASNLKTVRLPLPDLRAQGQIVAAAQSLYARMEDVERHQAASAAELEALLPATLDRAFRGEL